jgi:hypothetical protein
MKTTIGRYPVLAVGGAIGLVMAGADLYGGGSPIKAGASLAIVLTYAVLVTVVSRRREMMSALAGRPEDERCEHINLEACAYALGVSALVILAAFIVADASRMDWTPYAFMCAVIALSYVGSLAVLRVRH